MLMWFVDSTCRAALICLPFGALLMFSLLGSCDLGSGNPTAGEYNLQPLSDPLSSSAEAYSGLQLMSQSTQTVACWSRHIYMLSSIQLSPLGQLMLVGLPGRSAIELAPNPDAFPSVRGLFAEVVMIKFCGWATNC